MEKGRRFLQKLSIELPCDVAVLTSGYFSEKNKNTNLKGYLHSHVNCSIIYSN